MEDKKIEDQGEDGEEVAAELNPGDFAVLFHKGGSVEMIQSEGCTEEDEENIKVLAGYLEFVLQSDECWAMYQSKAEQEPATAPGSQLPN